MNIPAPFDQRQQAFRSAALDTGTWFAVAEGGKRGAKNVLMTSIFCQALETHPDKIHLIAGVSNATAKLNILDCDGFGMLNWFEGRCKEGKYKDRDCLYINTLSGQKVVLISGGGKSGDEKLIKGNTYGMAYITEANECTPAFIKEVFDRTLSSSIRKVFHDMNPKPPKHWYYEEIESYHKAQQARDNSYGYLYGHFTIADNMSISDDRLRRIMRTYDKNTVWYKRDILGKRVSAEGIIYRLFADNVQAYTVKPEDVPKERLKYICIGEDFGGNKSHHAYCASAVTADGRDVYVLMSRSYDAKDTGVDFITQKLREMCVAVCDRYGRVDEIRADCAEQAIINTQRAQVPWHVKNSIKNEINDRIRCEDLLISGNRLHIVAGENDALIDGLATAQWDEKTKSQSDIRLDDGTTNICILDAFEYSWELYIKYLVQGR